MTDFASMAARLYGGPAPAEQAPATPQPAASAASQLYDAPPEPQQATPEAAPTPAMEAKPADVQQALYGEREALPAIEIPENIQTMRAADGARQMYSPQGTYASVLPDDLWAGDETAKAIPEPVQRAALAELREMAADVAMSSDDVRALQSIARQIPEAPSDADRIAWREQAVTRLNETYGNGAAQAFRDARAFIAQDPRRAKILDNKGLGDHPDTVLMVARLARQARMQGKLK